MIDGLSPIARGEMFHRAAIVASATLLFVCPDAIAGECDSAPGTGELTSAAAQVEDGFIAMEAGDVRVAATRLQAVLPCVSAPLTPELSARVHRAVGLAAVVDADLDAAARSFWSARRADPTLRMTDSLAPLGTPNRTLFERPAPYVAGTVLERPRRGTLLLDGTSSFERPGNRPVIVQHLNGSGGLLGTWWVGAGAAMPTSPWNDPRRNARLGLRGVGLGLAVLGGGLLAGARVAASIHSDPERVDELDAKDLARLRDRSRGLTIAGSTSILLGSSAMVLSVSGALR